jgi:hypothetical protein
MRSVVMTTNIHTNDNNTWHSLFGTYENDQVFDKFENHPKSINTMRLLSLIALGAVSLVSAASWSFEDASVAVQEVQLGDIGTKKTYVPIIVTTIVLSLIGIVALHRQTLYRSRLFFSALAPLGSL